DAIGKASASDEVIVTAGSYEIASGAATLAPNVYIHGDPAGPMPTISTAASGFAFLIQAVGARDRLAYIHFSLKAQQTGATCGLEGSIESVVVTGVGSENAPGILQYANCLLRDSLVHVEGARSIAVEANAGGGIWTAPLRNVTAIATGPESTGVWARF